jgi:Zn-dependent peptidase ImmA (M78 family)
VAEVSAGAFSARFDWSEPLGVPTGAAVTSGSLTISLTTEDIWGSSEFEWAWIELLEWLTANWLALTVDDGLPFEANPDTSDHLNDIALASVGDSSGSLAEERAFALWQFRETHDFARALPGTKVAPLVFWREGFVGHVLTNDRHWLVSEWSGLQSFLSTIGNAIAERVAISQDERSTAAIAAWAARESAADAEIAEQATGISSAVLPIVLEHWRGRGVSEDLSESVARSEILAAARMTADLPDETIAAVLAEIASASRGLFSAIDKLSAEALPADDELDPFKPHEQGHWVAQRAREALGLDSTDVFDTDKWLSSLGVECREVSLGVAGIDAIAAWGADHGPVVIINRDGRHSRSAVGRNASIAHEIGHLLFDRLKGLPAAEVLGGMGNPFIERRARAFAAELLLPNSIARAAFDAPHSRDEVLRAVRSLSRRYRVSNEIVAWQARNSDRPLDESVRRTLATLVSAPWQY